MLSGAQLRVWRKQERVERVRRETTAALAHELKTPLSVLSATAELLGDNLAPEKQAHYLRHPAAGTADGRQCAADA